MGDDGLMSKDTKLAKKLTGMKEKLDETRLSLARMDGRLGDLKKRLTDKSGQKSVKGAKKILKRLRTKREDKMDELEEGVEKVERKYPWNT